MPSEEKRGVTRGADTEWGKKRSIKCLDGPSRRRQKQQRRNIG